MPCCGPVLCGCRNLEQICFKLLCLFVDSGGSREEPQQASDGQDYLDL